MKNETQKEGGEMEYCARQFRPQTYFAAMIEGALKHLHSGSLSIYMYDSGPSLMPRIAGLCDAASRGVHAAVEALQAQGMFSPYLTSRSIVNNVCLPFGQWLGAGWDLHNLVPTPDQSESWLRTQLSC